MVYYIISSSIVVVIKIKSELFFLKSIINIFNDNSYAQMMEQKHTKDYEITLENYADLRKKIEKKNKNAATAFESETKLVSYKIVYRIGLQKQLKYVLWKDSNKLNIIIILKIVGLLKFNEIKRSKNEK